MSEKTELLYGTNNRGKLHEVGTFLKGSGFELLSPGDLGIELDIEETGETLEENARLKAEAWHRERPDDLILTDDTGLEIDALGGEPGVHVRRWKDGKTRMTDDEIISYTIERLAGVPKGKRGAQFRTVNALMLPSGEIHMFDGVLRGEITEDPKPIRIPDFPFRGLFFIPEAGKFLGELEDDPDTDILTHRQRAAQKTVDWLRNELGSE